jgi:hypothetical protein
MSGVALGDDVWIRLSGGVDMKNWPLLWQIWVWFVGLVIGVGALILVVTPFSLDGFFSDEMQKQLDTAQTQFVNRLTSALNGTNSEVPNGLNDRFMDFRDIPNNVRQVRHYLFLDGQEIAPNMMGRNDGGSGRNGDFGMGGRRGLSREISQALLDQIQNTNMQNDVPIIRIQ